ncbi:MAG TPA: DegT/DnrJ/EryC1/StrS family aminotransferase [Chitinophagales bacterium]|nr:DegT/DnrJ/EryC1/StrS family aminotransferase [Chitinophagales bacterium]
MINVTKTFLPPLQEYEKYLKGIWERGWITNNGQLVQELEQKLKEFLGVKHLFFCTNGTVVLQMAIKALGLSKEIITTPYSYVATVNSILWEGCQPVFVDISNNDFNIDANKIEAAITENTEAILATHVYGNPCDIEQIEAIALKHKLKVIYDGAHAFACVYNDKSVLSFGDISTCSFHATKVFHTVEGGAIITNDDALAKRFFHFRQFGHYGDEYFSVGINAKNSELHAAMGHCVFTHLNEIIASRKRLSDLYNELLKPLKLQVPLLSDHVKYNYAYYPVVFPTHEILMRVIDTLAKQEIAGRRYFYPSLNTLSFVNGTHCPVSENVSERVLSLPLFHDLDPNVIHKICDIIKSCL